LEGRTLDKVIAEGGLTLEQAVTILEQIAGALDLIPQPRIGAPRHQPANIMIGEDGQATVLDFGIVRAAEGTRLTTTMAVVGTPEYMAPEQAEVAEGVEIDWRADLYALSVVAYEMLVGKLPFTGSSPTAVLYKHVYEAPPRPTVANPALLPGVEPVLLKGLAKRSVRSVSRRQATSLRQLRQAALDDARIRHRHGPRQTSLLPNQALLNRRARRVRYAYRCNRPRPHPPGFFWGWLWEGEGCCCWHF
jgi:serine/threonine-protein kinase